VQRASWAKHCQPWLAEHLSQLGRVLPAQDLPDRASIEGQTLPAHGKLYSEAICPRAFRPSRPLLPLRPAMSAVLAAANANGHDRAGTAQDSTGNGKGDDAKGKCQEPKGRNREAKPKPSAKNPRLRTARPSQRPIEVVLRLMSGAEAPRVSLEDDGRPGWASVSRLRRLVTEQPDMPPGCCLKFLIDDRELRKTEDLARLRSKPWEPLELTLVKLAPTADELFEVVRQAFADAGWDMLDGTGRFAKFGFGGRRLAAPRIAEDLKVPVAKLSSSSVESPTVLTAKMADHWVLRLYQRIEWDLDHFFETAIAQ